MTQTADARVAQALRQIAKGFGLLADAVEGEPARPDNTFAREAAMIKDWGSRGLTQKEASQLCQRHGFAPQKIGAWVNGGWADVRSDGLRYVTEKSVDWAANVPS